MNSAGLTAIFKKQPIGFSGAVLGLVLAGLLYVRSDQIALRTAFKTNLIGESKLSEIEENKLWLTPTLKTDLQSAYTWYILKLCKRILSARV